MKVAGTVLSIMLGVVLILSLPVQYTIASAAAHFGFLTFGLMATVILIWRIFGWRMRKHPDVLQRLTLSGAAIAIQILTVLIFRYTFFPHADKKNILTAIFLIPLCWLGFKQFAKNTHPGVLKRGVLSYTIFLLTLVAGVTAVAFPWSFVLILVLPAVLFFEILNYFKLQRYLSNLCFFIVGAAYTYFLSLALLGWTGIGAIEMGRIFFFALLGHGIISLGGYVANRCLPRYMKTAGIVCGAVVVISVMHVMYWQFTPWDCRSVQNDFIIHYQRPGGYAMALDPAGRYLFSLHGEDVSAIVKLDTAGAGKPEIFGLKKQSRPERLLYDTKRNRIVITNWGAPDQRLVVMDPATFKPVKVLGEDTLCSNPIDITSDREMKYYYVLCEPSGVVVKLDADTLEETARKKAVNVAYGICYNHKRNSVFVSSWMISKLVELSAARLRVENVLPTSHIIYNVECDTDNGDVLATNPANRRIDVYDGETLRLKRFIPTDYGVRDMQFDQESNLLVAGSFVTGFLNIIDASTGRSLDKWYAGRIIRGVYYEPDSGRIFAAGKCGILELKLRFPRRRQAMRGHGG